MPYNRYTLHVEYIGPLSGYYCWIKLDGLTVAKAVARKAEWALEDAKEWCDSD